MQRALDIAQFCFSLAGLVMVLWVGNLVASNQVRLSRELDRNAVVLEQMLKDHLQQLRDHERLMAPRNN